MKSWEKQAWRFRRSLMCLDLATIVAFNQEVRKDEYRRYNYGWSERDKHTYMPREGYALLFQRLRERKLDSATLGYLRLRIDAQFELWSSGFERVPDYSDARHTRWHKQTWLQDYALHLQHFMRNREAIVRGDREWSELVCDCAVQFWQFGCQHSGWLSERTIYRKDQDLNRTSILIGVPLGLIIIAYAFAQSMHN